MRGLPRPGAEALFGTALAAALTAIGLRAGGGLSLGPTTTLWTILDLAAGLLGALSLLAATGRRAWGGAAFAAFAAFAALTALSILWAIQPSDAWLEANRTIAYLAVFGAGLVLARQGGAWWQGALCGVLAATTAISAYAIITKVFPGTFASEEVYARLREPYHYWNAVGLTAGLGVLPALWLGARRHGHAARNALAYPALGILLLAMLLAYSRGSLLAVAIGCIAWFAVVPLRLRGVTVLAGGAVGALLVAAWAFGQSGLSEDRVALELRESAGHELGIAVVAMVLALLALGLAIGFAGARRAPSQDARRQAGVAVLAALALVPVGVLLTLAFSEKGLGGSISSGWKSLTDPDDETPLSNDPGRLTKVGSVRAKYWDESYRIFRAHPWTGVGAGGYATARPRYRKDTLAVRHSHGYIVQTAADLGVLGLVSTLLLLVAWLWATARTLALRPPRWAARLLRRPMPPPRAAFTPERVGLATLAGVPLVFGVHSFVDWTWFVPGCAVIALLCAGWVAGRGPSDVEPAASASGLGARLRAGVRNPVRVLAAVFVLALAGCAAWAAQQPRVAVDKGNDALAELEDVGKDRGAIDRARELALEARDANPLSVEPLYELAVIETIAGRKDAAHRALVQAVRLQPANSSTWLRLAQFAIDQQDDPKRAVRLLGPAVHLDPKSPAATAIYLDALRRAQTKPAP